MTSPPTAVDRLNAAQVPVGRLNATQGAAVSIGAVLGTGVVSLPAIAAQIAGPASLIAWFALIALSIPLATTFAALGARYPDAGGVSTYVRRAFGGRAAAVVGWCFYFAVSTGAPAGAMFGAAYVSAALGGGRRTTLVTMAVIIAVVTVMNLWGVRISGRLQLILAAVLVTLLVVATGTALPHAHWHNLHPFAPHGWFSILPAAAVLVWGFAGWEAVTSLAADFRRPDRDLPRATAVAIVVVGALYLAIAVTSFLVLGAATGSTDAPLSELLAIGIGGSARVITAFVALLLTLGAMNAYYGGGAKLGSALGRDGALPAWFAKGSGIGEVPRRSLLVITGLSTLGLVIVAVTGSGPRPSVLLTTGSFVAVYILGTAAAIKLLPRGSWSRRAAAVAFVSVVALLFFSGPYVLWTLVVAAAALLYHRRSQRHADLTPAVTPPVASTAAHLQ